VSSVVTENSEYGYYVMMRENWSEAYLISRAPGAEKPYVAERRDDGGRLEASTAAEPRTMIHADYQARPVPRDAR
jgi:hypothetical protein